METARLPIRSCIRYGWETFKKRPWFFIGVMFLVALINIIIPDAKEEYAWPVFIPVLVISMILSILLELGMMHLMIRAHDGVETARLKDLWYPRAFWRYLGTAIVAGVLVILGLIALIIPGIIIALGLSFALYLVIDKGLGTKAAIKESWRMTRGNRWRLFLFLAVVVLLNIAGAVLLLVGLLVSIPVSMIATVHAYRFLEQTSAIPEEPAVSSEPAPQPETGTLETPAPAAA